jgi:hypothetical protein
MQPTFSMADYGNQPFVVLKHDEWERCYMEFVNNPDSHPLGPLVWHIEPLKRFKEQPPRNYHWKLLEVFRNQEDALAFLEKEYDRQEVTLRKLLQDKELGSSCSRFDIFKRDGYKCQICGRSPSEDGVKIEVDHKIPRSKGGSSSPSNLWTLCFDCNRSKRAKDL